MSTVPLGCEYRCSEQSAALCRADVSITFSENGNNEIAFQADEINAGTKTCDTSFSVTQQFGLGTPLKVPMSIYPKDDGKYDGTEKVDVQFELITDNSMWNEITFDLQVLVHDINSNYARRTGCSFYNDPHAHNFDGRSFEIQLAGGFKVMRHLQYPIDIEAYFQNFGGYTGVCGVAVRSGDNLYVVRYCRAPIIARSYQCDSSSSLIVDRQDDQFRFYLPTGTKVEFRKGSLNIYPSASDRNNVEGVCGNYNGDKDDDFIIKDTGDMDPNTYAPNDFSNSWRVEEKEWLFNGNIIDNGYRTFEAREFCECDSTGVRRCSPLPITNKVIKGTKVPPGENCQRSKRSIVYSDFVTDEDEFVFDYDPNYVAPSPQWTNGWTQSSAENFCNDYLLSNAILLSCADLIEIDDAVISCIDDIHITGTTDYAKTQFDMLLSQCINEAEKYDIDSGNPDSNYTNPYKDVLESVCYSDCNGNGICENGVCQCHANYTGYDCSLDQNHIPTIQPFYSHGLCDRLARPCQDTGLYADLLLESDNLKCLVQVMDVSYAPVSEAVVYTGVMEHYQKVFCHIPDHTIPYIVSIAVSNDNQHYSEPQHLLIYHSTCWACNLESGCEKKKSSCVIDQSCIAERETNPSNADEHCDPELDEYGWSPIPKETVSKETSPDSLKTGAIIGISVASAIVFIIVIAIVLAIIKHNSNKKASRVTSTVNLDTTHSIVPEFLGGNQNGMPPSQDQVDFKTMSLKPGVTPLNRLAPLTTPSNQHTIQVKPTDEDFAQAVPKLGHGAVLPPVRVQGLSE